MAADDSSSTQAEQSGLVVRVPEAEPAVRVWRDRLGPSARAAVPAHVTVLFPFLHESRLDGDTLAAIDGVIGRHRPFEVRFERCGRFQGILYLAPEPGTPFRRITEAIVRRWPEIPPFGGQFDDIVPHLTIVQGQDDAVLDEAEADLRGRLPITARVSSVDLIVHDGSQWQQRAAFALR
ncbi:2'-5' RNA ligase family protein [Streptomyces sp. NPDC005251]|uniref:2'-5' RNA ligase family protein n=1 Tax=Streptomyces sp. NPDC005251 TaxID=3157166 RepID=UPI0033A0A043